jgi:rhodanese-related sulfurtransferase
MKKSIRKLFFLILPIVVAFPLLLSCGGEKNKGVKDIDGFAILIEYLESQADYINQAETPFFATAIEVFANMSNNYLVIDIRTAEEYENAHIENSLNVLPKDIVKFFEEKIHPPAFEKIVLVCNAGDASAFIAMGMRYLGYMNVFPLRFGLSSWDMEIAKEHRLKYISDSHRGKLETQVFDKNPPGDFPVIKTKHQYGYDILRERIIELLNQDINNYSIGFDEIDGNYTDYYVVSYWPKERYDKGHLYGSPRYQPRKSLKFNEQLNTLPLDKPIVLQCYSGNNSNFVAMYLSILGYDARSLLYGAGNYDYTTMKLEEPSGRHFAAEKDVSNYPLIRKSDIEFQVLPPTETPKTPQGGC